MRDNVFSDPLELVQRNSERFQEEAAREFFDYMMLVARVFGTEDGVKLLKILREQTIESGTWLSSIVAQRGLDAATAHGFAREGQNAVVKRFEELIELAKHVRTPDDLINHNL